MPSGSLPPSMQSKPNYPNGRKNRALMLRKGRNLLLRRWRFFGCFAFFFFLLKNIQPICHRCQVCRRHHTVASSIEVWNPNSWTGGMDPALRAQLPQLPAPPPWNSRMIAGTPRETNSSSCKWGARRGWREGFSCQPGVSFHCCMRPQPWRGSKLPAYPLPLGGLESILSTRISTAHVPAAEPNWERPRLCLAHDKQPE